jgi:hypothetical protein
MSLGDFRCQSSVAPKRFLVKAGTANSIKAGEPVVQDTGSDTEYVEIPPLSLGVSTAQTFVGIAKTTSTDTASADGFVWVSMPSAGTSYIGEATTPSNLASTSRLTKVVMEKTSGKFTLDENNTTGGFCQIVDYDANTLDVEFVVDMTEILNA